MNDIGCTDIDEGHRLRMMVRWRDLNLKGAVGRETFCDTDDRLIIRE